MDMNLHISNSKNAESFYICKSYVKANGSTSSMIVRKLGTLKQLLTEHGLTRDDILKISEDKCQIEECFLSMKTDFSAFVSVLYLISILPLTLSSNAQTYMYNKYTFSIRYN